MDSKYFSILLLHRIEAKANHGRCSASVHWILGDLKLVVGFEKKITIFIFTHSFLSLFIDQRLGHREISHPLFVPGALSVELSSDTLKAAYCMDLQLVWWKFSFLFIMHHSAPYVVLLVSTVSRRISQQQKAGLMNVLHLVHLFPAAPGLLSIAY